MALNHLMRMVNHCPPLLEALRREGGYERLAKTFTMRQTLLIYEYLGETIILSFPVLCPIVSLSHPYRTEASSESRIFATVNKKQALRSALIHETRTIKQFISLMIEYDLKKNNNKKNEKAYGKYYAKPHISETVDLDELAGPHAWSQLSILSRDHQGHPHRCRDPHQGLLLMGKNVKLDNLAIF